MKAAKRKILPLFWLLVSVFQLPFAAQLAPAKSISGLENRVWKIFPLAAQTHQVSQLQIAEMQRERAPPSLDRSAYKYFNRVTLLIWWSNRREIRSLDCDIFPIPRGRAEAIFSIPFQLLGKVSQSSRIGTQWLASHNTRSGQVRPS
jgi:hypothetical protein